MNITPTSSFSVTTASRNLQCEWFSGAGDAARKPTVIFLPDLFGVTDGLRENAARLAAEGYNLVLPDLYTSTSARRYCLRMVFDAACRNNAADAPPLQEIHCIVDAVKARPDVDAKRIGLIGMCLTGGFALHMALRDDIKAPVVFHHSFGREGSGLPDACAAQISKSIQGHFVSIDPFCPKRRVDALAAQLGEKLERNTYHAIPHGIPHFFRSHPQGRKAWDNLLRFLRLQLQA